MKKILIFILPLLISLSAHAHPGWLYNINSNEVQIMDLETKKLIRTVETGSIDGVDVSQDGKILYIANFDHLLLFNTSTGEKTKKIKLLRQIQRYKYMNLRSHEVLHLLHNRWILIDTDNAFQVYDTQTDKLSLIPQKECSGHFKWTNLKDGSFIQRCSGGGSKHFYLETGNKFKLGKSQKIDFINKTWIMGKSTEKAYSIDEENLLIWDLITQKIEKKSLKNSNDSYQYTLSPDESKLAYLQYEGWNPNDQRRYEKQRLLILDLKNLSVLHNIQLPDKSIIFGSFFDLTGAKIYVILNQKEPDETKEAKKPNFMEIEVSSGKIIYQNYIPYLGSNFKIAPKP